MVGNRFLIKFLSIFFLILLSGILFLPLVGQAGGGGAGGKRISFTNPLEFLEEKEGVKDIPTLIYFLIRKIREFGIPLAVAVMAFGGFKFVTAGGNEEKVTEARKVFTYAVVGVVLLLGAEMLMDAISSFMGLKGAKAGKDIELYQKFIDLIRYFYGIVFALSVAFLSWGGLKYLRAGGDEQQIAEAKKNTLYGIIGLMIILGVWVIIVLISNVLGLKEVPQNPF
jgi:hypothetical protein